MSRVNLHPLEASSIAETSVEYQRKQWNALKNEINRLVNEANQTNICSILKQLFKQNIVHGTGLFTRSVIKAQAALPGHTSVYAALVSVINLWIEPVGILIGQRLISSFRRQYKSNEIAKCLSTIKFVAHLVNQNVLHEIIALQLLLFLLHNPSDDDVELAIEFVKECGQKLSQVNPRGLNSIFSTFKDLLKISSNERTQNMIEALFVLQKDKFKENPAISTGLNFVHENYQCTHMIPLECGEPVPFLAAFTYDPKYKEHEEQYKVIQKLFFQNCSDDEKYEEKYNVTRKIFFQKSSDDENESSSMDTNDENKSNLLDMDDEDDGKKAVGAIPCGIKNVKHDEPIVTN
ncbi:unnamed protein product [Rotaria sp. Silwood2]|nr:unnamed protein product [Rotaria sp. Silwood2]CAF3081870.1 unnamed protein product [Rotaria sp. Silwood2]CAF3240343.1 unnamed protein product [Rotaria sp. Silwood2]CAF4327052.1 unnamed protein product [Rotaria sp. Silwood2]CAF4364807.1 unnamed protein product [Rotaria sp. Silwood2]